MQFVRYEAQGRGPRLGLLEDGRVHDLEATSGGRVAAGDMKAFIAGGSEFVDGVVRAERAQYTGADAAAKRHRDSLAVDEVRLLAPIGNPGRFLAVAGGYYTGPDEPRLGRDATPYFFCKMTDDVRGPGDPITVWKIGPDVLDEIEIAIVIGTGGKDIPRHNAMEHVAGYTICNDVSGRRLALPPAGRRDESFDTFIDWINGKWLDGYAILGPALVTPDEVGDLTDIRLVSRVSGEVRTEGTTKNVNFPFDELIAYASSLMTLRPGDVITTGVPEGDGTEVYLKPGDVVECQIDRLGVLRNPVVAEAQVAT